MGVTVLFYKLFQFKDDLAAIQPRSQGLRGETVTKTLSLGPV